MGRDCCKGSPSEEANACNGNTHVHSQLADSTTTNALCLALIHENGADVVIFDASGHAKTFSNVVADVRDLCFSTHNYHTQANNNNNNAESLTPCFDEHGNHGVPEERCFCGVDTPHLHAHLREACDRSGSERALQILHPSETADALNICVSASMPKECNSAQIEKQLLQAKTTMRQMHAVNHDDHVDFLVHNVQTGELHLQHPCAACGSDDVHGTFQTVAKRHWQRQGKLGGEVSLHFFSVDKSRPFNVLEHLFDLESDRARTVDNLKPASMRNVSFVPPEPLEQSKSSPSLQETSVVRSTFVCTQICCSAEIPMINNILEHIAGVEKILINVPLKRVIVDHDASLLSATDLAKVLNQNQFGASIQSDGTTNMVAKEFGRSQFHVQHICCASEIPAINGIVQPLPGVSQVAINTTTKMVTVDHNLILITAQAIEAALNQAGFGASIRLDAGRQSKSASTFVRSTLLLEQGDITDTQDLAAFLKTYNSTQVETFKVDVPNKMITVAHNPFSLSAQEIADALSATTSVKAIVQEDGASSSAFSLPEFDENVDGLPTDEKFTWPKPTVVLSGLCWIISMLSYIGGNWYVKFVFDVRCACTASE
jgi:copper chaperone CopZ